MKPNPIAELDMSEWKPPHEREDYTIKKERAPWGRWLLSLFLLGLIIAGAIWLASKVIVPDNIPSKRVDLPKSEAPAEPVVKKSADDEAWVRALEKDTLAGYREYLEAFPEGRHKDEAQAQIDAYDNKAWARAEQRNTIAGYEDYLAAWPEGLHASKALPLSARIGKMRRARIQFPAIRPILPSIQQALTPPRRAAVLPRWKPALVILRHGTRQNPRTAPPPMSNIWRAIRKGPLSRRPWPR